MKSGPFTVALQFSDGGRRDDPPWPPLLKGGKGKGSPF